MQSDDSDPTMPTGGDVPERFSVDFTGLTLLGNYRVDEKVADGGMGSVYLGEDTNLGRRVVLKVPHARFLGEAGFRQRFALEITELVRLEHPNVVGILAQGEHEDIPFFVLQYLGGGSLDERLSDEGTGPDDLADVLTWAGTIARTLDFIHARGTIHRDVKPGNVLFDEEGHVFLSDFGVAKTLESQGIEVTEAGISVGSPRYMAPEQGMGGDLTPSADQYALASLIYEAFAGHPPYREETPLKILLAKHNEDPDPVHEIVEHVPVAAGETIARAMARDPADRFPSCVAFFEALEAGLQPKPEPAARPRAGKGALYLLGAALGALTLGGVLFSTGFFGTETTDKPEEEDSIRLVLLSAGDAPRRRLRYTVQLGQVDRVVLRASRRIQRVVEGKKIDFMRAPGVVMEGDMRYLGPDRPGQVAFEWTTTRVAAEETAEFKREDLDALNQKLQPVESVRAKGRTSARGTHSSADIESADEMTPDVWGYAQVLSNSLQRFAVPLPEEEVGVGAQWEVTAVENLFDLRLVVTTTYEITGLEGQQVRLRFNMAQVAHKQPFSPPGLPDSLKSELIRFSGDGVGHLLLDLDGLVSTSQAEVDTSMTMRLYSADGGENKTLETTVLVIKTLVATERR